jgi:hypothetical protein
MIPNPGKIKYIDFRIRIDFAVSSKAPTEPSKPLLNRLVVKVGAFEGFQTSVVLVFDFVNNALLSLVL